ncbi:phosphogluconate dehydrogenase [Tanacetum coccineum]
MITEVSSIFSKNMQLRSGDEPNTCNSAELAEAARIWKDGCIIRAIFLQRIKRHMTEPEFADLLVNPEVKSYNAYSHA